MQPSPVVTSSFRVAFSSDGKNTAGQRKDEEDRSPLDEMEDGRARYLSDLTLIKRRRKQLHWGVLSAGELKVEKSPRGGVGSLPSNGSLRELACDRFPH